jgi:hypothetical protein
MPNPAPSGRRKPPTGRHNFGTPTQLVDLTTERRVRRRHGEQKGVGRPQWYLEALEKWILLRQEAVIGRNRVARLRWPRAVYVTRSC